MVILVKGAAYRAARYPGGDCKLFLDFTKLYTCSESLVQGMIGRATGWDKNGAAVFVSERNAEIVKASRDYYAQTGEEVLLHVKSKRAIQIGTPRKRDRFEIDLHDLAQHDPVLAASVVSAITTNVGPFLHYRSNSKNANVNDVHVMKRGAAKAAGLIPRSGIVSKGATVCFDYEDLFGGVQNFIALMDYVRHKMNNPLVKPMLPSSPPRTVQKKNGVNCQVGFKSPDGKHLALSVGNNMRALSSSGASARGIRFGAGRSVRTGFLYPEVVYSLHPSNPSLSTPLGILVWFDDDYDHNPSKGARHLPGKRSAYNVPKVINP